MRMNILLISTSIILTTLLLIMNYNFYGYIVSLKPNLQLIHITSDKFLSFGLDSSLLRDMKNLPIIHEKFINLTRQLSPAYIRIGGTAADCLYFNKNISIIKEKLSEESQFQNPVNKQNINNFTLTGDDFLSIYKFSQKTGIKIIFDLNTLLRNTDGSWNSDNAKEIILFAKSHEMEIDWQMGNEPNSFFHVFNITISAKQLSKDYCKLRSILNDLGYKDSILIGPEVNHIGNEDHQGVIYGINFLNKVNSCINYFTWHQYYLNGYVAELEDFLNIEVFNLLSRQIDTMATAIRLNDHNLYMWLSETGSAYGGGAPELSNRYVAGFLWLDKLGYSAKAGIQVVIRQSLFGGNYAMIDENLDPNPDWWVALLFKQFVSNKVLNLNTPDNFGNIRLYAHCASKQSVSNDLPTVVIYGVNLNKEHKQIYIHGLPSDSNIFSYILTSDNLQSRNIFMNGKILRLQNNGNVPHLNPKVVKASQGIKLPPYSIIYLLIHMNVSSCS